jgi:hypothetical protein
MTTWHDNLQVKISEPYMESCVTKSHPDVPANAYERVVKMVRAAAPNEWDTGATHQPMPAWILSDHQFVLHYSATAWSANIRLQLSLAFGTVWDSGGICLAADR